MQHEDERSDAAQLLYRVKSVLSLYEEAGLGAAREASFLRSCSEMIEKRGTVTVNMTRWLDALLAQGGPQRPSDESADLADRLDALLPEAGIHAEFISSTVQRLRSGRTISERHTAAVEKVAQRILDARSKGDLTEGETRALSFARIVLFGYSTSYTRERPQTFANAHAVCEKIERGEKIGRVEWDALVSAATRLKDIANPKFSVGDLVYLKTQDKPVLIVGLPDSSDDGTVSYSVLCDGQILQVSQAYLRTRFPRGG